MWSLPGIRFGIDVKLDTHNSPSRLAGFNGAPLGVEAEAGGADPQNPYFRTNGRRYACTCPAPVTYGGHKHPRPTLRAGVIGLLGGSHNTPNAANARPR